MTRSPRSPGVALASLVASLLAACLLVASPSPAATMAPYSQQAFADAQRAGKPIVVFVHAGWCVTCRRQEPVLKQLTAEPAFADVAIFVVDYDRDKAALRELNIADRSTLVAYHGKSERKRASFVTDPAAIRALVESAL